MNVDTIFIEPFNFDVNSIISESIEEKSTEIVRLNKAQLAIGEDSDGNSLGEYSTFSYKNRWKPVDLNLTGAFWKSFVAVPLPSNDAFDVVAFDEKTYSLVKRYGELILGLSNDSIDELASILYDPMQEKYNMKIEQNINSIAA